MRIEQVGESIHFVEGDAVSWTIVSTDDGLTLIDAGYPGDFDDVVASIRRIGRSVDELRAILVTHAHIDHVGAIPPLLEQRTVPVYTCAEEARHARREYQQQATPVDVATNLWRPGALRWVRHIVTKGATHDVVVPSAAAVAEHAPVDVPGRPVPLVVAGHTAGHTCYLLDGGSVLVSGDALVTGHMLSRRAGPQLLAAFFDHDRQRHLDTLSLLAGLDATTVLPGHGPAYHGAIGDAVEQALRTA